MPEVIYMTCTLC